MKRYFLTPLLFAFCFSLQAQNLIVNGSCDSALVAGNIPGWKELLGNDWQQRTASPAPFSGVGYFFAGAVDVGILGQDINVANYAQAIDSGIQKFRFIGYARSFDQSPPDDGYFRIRFVKADTTLYTIHDFGPYLDRLAWVKLDTLLSAPVGTRSVAVEIKSVRHGNTNNDGYFDELSLTPVKICNPKSITLEGYNFICVGETADICAPQGFSAYQWNEGQGQACISTSDSGKYYVTAFDVNSCPVLSDTLSVTVNPLPVAVITGADTICAGDSVQLCTTPGMVTYTWSNQPDNSQECIYVKSAGNSTVTVMDNNGCVSVSEQVVVEQYSSTEIVVAVLGDTLVCVTNAISYQWYANDTAIPNATAVRYIYPNYNVEYYVKVVDENGCRHASQKVLPVITGVRNFIETTAIIYPNPSTGNWQLKVDNNLIGGEMTVYDANGKLVLQSEIKSTTSEIALDVAKGIYWLRITSGSGNITRKLIRL